MTRNDWTFTINQSNKKKCSNSQWKFKAYHFFISICFNKFCNVQEFKIIRARVYSLANRGGGGRDLRYAQKQGRNKHSSSKKNVVKLE